MSRPLTIITFTTAPLEDEQPLTDKAMATIASVQDAAKRIGPEQWDLLVLQDVGDFKAADLRRMGAEQAKTDWVSFVNEGEEVKPHALEDALAMITDATAYACGCEGLLWWRREYWLAKVAS